MIGLKIRANFQSEVKLKLTVTRLHTLSRVSRRL